MISRIITIVALTSLLAGLIGCNNNEADQQEKVERHLKSAQVYFRQGQYRAAMLEARNVLQQGQKTVPAYEVLANVYNQVGAFRQTQRIPADAIAQSDLLAIALAESYVATKKYRSALDTLTPVSLNPDSELGLRFHKVKGEALLYLSAYDELEQHIKSLGLVQGQAAESLRGYLEAAYQLAGSNPAAARDILDKVLKADPNYFPALTLRGDIALFFNEQEAAERFYTQALGTLKNADVLTAEKSTVLGRLIETLTQLGRATEAYTYQKILSEANPEGISAQQRFADALERYSNGDLEAANQILQELHEQFPEDQNAGTLLGLVSQRMGDYDKADELFSQFMDEETVSPAIIQAATIAKLATSQSKDALLMLQRACELQPDNAAIWATYGLALTELKSEPKEIIRALERSLALEPNQPRLRLALAGAYNRSDKTQQAIAQLSKAYEMAPTDFLVQQAYYRALVALGEREQLAQLIDEFVKANPELAQGHFFTGWLLTDQQKYKQAEAAFERALSKADKRIASLSHAALADLHEKMGESVKVTQDWENAIKAAPNALYAYQRWIVSLHRRNQIDSAEARLSALKIPDQYWQPEFTLANLAFQLRDYDKTLKLIEIVLEKRPELEAAKALAAKAYQQQAFAAFGAQDLVQAKKLMLKAVAAQPSNMGYVANLVKLHLDSGDVAEAKTMLGQFGTSNKELAIRAFLEGKIHEHEGKQPEALQAYRQSWDLAPTDLAGQAVFSSLRKSSENAKAAIFLDEWQTAMESSAQPIIYKAMNAQAAKDDASAKAYYLRALDINSAQPVVLNNLAWIVQKDSLAEAVSYARKAYELAPSSPAIIDTLGWMLVESGEVKEGIEFLQIAHNLAPENTEISEHLKSAKARQ